MIPAEDTTSLSLLFHLNSEPSPARDGEIGAGYRVEFLKLGGAAIALPPPCESHLGKLIRERYSCRAFVNRVMEPATLGTLLWAANGLTRRGQLPDGTVCINRSIPSAGGLYPLELYVWLQRVNSVPDGLYHYEVWNHALEPVAGRTAAREFQEALVYYPFVKEANAVLLIAAMFLRTQQKYGPRGYRYILLEAGHAAQNICLAATEAGLASLCIGGYWDRKLNALLKLDPTRAGVLYVLGLGYPSGDSQSATQMW